MVRASWFDRRNQTGWAREQRRKAGLPVEIPEHWKWKFSDLQTDKNTPDKYLPPEKRKNKAMADSEEMSVGAALPAVVKVVSVKKKRSKPTVRTSRMDKIIREAVAQRKAARKAAPGYVPKTLAQKAAKILAREAKKKTAPAAARRQAFYSYLYKNPDISARYDASNKREKAKIAREFYKAAGIGMYSPERIAARKEKAAKDKKAGVGIFSKEAKAKAAAKRFWYWNYGLIRTRGVNKKGTDRSTTDNAALKAALKAAMMKAARKYMTANPNAKIVHGYY